VAALLLMLPLSFGFRIRKGHALGRWHRSATFVGTLWTSFKFLWWRKLVSKETPLDDPRQQTDQGSHSQTDKPWKGNPEKEQRPRTKKSDPYRKPTRIERECLNGIGLL